MNTTTKTGLVSVRIKKGFWRQKTDLVAREMLPFQWKALNDQIPEAEPSHALENFRIAAGEAEGAFVGTIWQDSDVAKWLEAASYSLADGPNDELEAHVDEAIRLIGKAQGPDGYVNTWFTLVGPDKRWTDLPWGHELYSGGHLIEAAVAHFQSTGSRRFLDIMVRYADGLIAVFGPGGPHQEDACGHPEIELALHRLADATGEARFRDLAAHFVDVRGTHPDRFLDKKPLGFEIPQNQWFKEDYFLAHVPVRQQHHAEGHAVRAMYLYNAMARQARETGDAKLKATLEDLWTSVTERRMYVTGSLGSHAMGERFSVDYDLPPDTAYNETCASIGFLFWARTMLDLDRRGRYADAMERVLFNGALSGMALDGKRYFYVNPLEVVPRVARARQDLEHVKTARVPWFGCSCCPPNIARLVTSIGQYAWSQKENTIAVDLFLDSEARFSLDSGPVVLTLSTNYPWDGAISLAVQTDRPRRFALAVRIPGWCESYTLGLGGKDIGPMPQKDGYVVIDREWSDGDELALDLAMPVRFLMAHARVADVAGRVAVARGPLIFCAEEVDNGGDLHNLTIDPTAPVEAAFLPQLMGGSLQLTAQGWRRTSSDAGDLYPPWSSKEKQEAVDVVLVPYHQWGNRRPGQEMRVWLRAEA